MNNQAVNFKKAVTCVLQVVSFVDISSLLTTLCWLCASHLYLYKGDIVLLQFCVCVDNTTRPLGQIFFAPANCP